MVNNCNDPEQIIKAHQAGLISKEDFQKWCGAQGYKNELRKSKESGAITDESYSEEFAKADSLYFLKDQSSYTFRYVLCGKDFQPLDLIPKKQIQKSLVLDSLNKSNEPTLLKSNRTCEGLKKVAAEYNKSIDNLVGWCKANIKKK